VLVEERYSYEQMISRNPSIGRSAGVASSGSIEVVTPYDGYTHFTRDAVADVCRRLPEQSEFDVEAVIGHLVLVGHHDTDLAASLSLDGRFGAHRLAVPVRGPQLQGVDPLYSARYEHRFATSYSPARHRPVLVPIELDVGIADPDTIDGIMPTEQFKTFADDDTVWLERVADAIKRFISFKPFLQLTITVRCTLPPRLNGHESSAPVVRSVAVTLPTQMSLARSSLELLVGGKRHDVQYRPESRHLEWINLNTAPVSSKPDAPRRFETSQMALRFHQPGELFLQERLKLKVDVEVPGELLSGTEIRLFDARGYRIPHTGSPLTVRSMVSTTCIVAMRETFGKRLGSAYQSFHFDEVVPDPLRITDIRAALEDQRCTIDYEQTLTTGEGKRELLRHFLVAKRVDGPDVLTLYILVEGRRHVTQREARRPGGHRYTSKFDSGELWVYVRGQAPRDARTAVREINQLHLTLRERFRHLRAQR
jgi:hypothetical protein